MSEKDISSSWTCMLFLSGVGVPAEPLFWLPLPCFFQSLLFVPPMFPLHFQLVHCNIHAMSYKLQNTQFKKKLICHIFKCAQNMNFYIHFNIFIGLCARLSSFISNLIIATNWSLLEMYSAGNFSLLEICSKHALLHTF